MNGFNLKYVLHIVIPVAKKYYTALLVVTTITHMVLVVDGLIGPPTAKTRS